MQANFKGNTEFTREGRKPLDSCMPKGAELEGIVKVKV